MWARQTSTIPNSEDYHRYTRGRFVCDEVRNMAKRYVAHDIVELTKIAAQATGSQSCVEFEKLPEGLHSKVFLMTMNDGAQVVAKLPNPCGGRPHFTTTSEVATMDYVRHELAIPVPKVHAWCSRAADTTVNAEYIIMEKAKGLPIAQVYDQLAIKERWKLGQTLAGYQLLWSAAKFETYGSLYYKKDLGSEVRDEPASSLIGTTRELAFGIGPTAGVEWNEYDQLRIGFDRGPWSSASDYFKAIGERELLCIQQMDRLPQSGLTLCGPGIFTPSRSKKRIATLCYLDILDNLLPRDTDLLRPSLAHPDLHAENIYVDPQDPSQITAILDWSSTEIAPLMVQARQPQLIDYDGPKLSGLVRPTLPTDLADMSEAEQSWLRLLHLKQNLVALYRTLMSKRDPNFWKCIEYQETPAFELLTIARGLLRDGEAPYLARIIELLESGSDLVKVQRPVNVASQERIAALFADKSSIYEYLDAATAGAKMMERIQQTLGDLFPEQGIVRHDQYAGTKRALSQIKEKVIQEFARTEADKAAWEESWPFDD